jgi:hypothetical protein
MAKLIYAMITSLDGYTEDEHGRFGWAPPTRGALLHQRTCFVIRRLSLRTEDVRDHGVWEAAHTVPDQPRFVLDFARQ